MRGPAGEPVDLARTLNSHGFTELAPARLDAEAGGLELTLRPAGSRPRRVRVLPGRAGRASVQVLGGGKPSPRQEAALTSGVRHVLRLDQDLAGFYRLAGDDPDLEWVTSGAGRMVRSPTVFEDVVKTICTIFRFPVPTHPRRSLARTSRELTPVDASGRCG